MQGEETDVQRRFSLSAVPEWSWVVEGLDF
jgi:hypothetical protein